MEWKKRVTENRIQGEASKGMSAGMPEEASEGIFHKRLRKKRKPQLTLIRTAVFFLLFLLMTQEVSAAGRLTYGSQEYIPAVNGEFPVGVYVSADEPIGSYEAVIAYDPDYLSYVSGGELLQEGRVRIRGGGGADSYKTMLAFRTLLMGESDLTVERLRIYRDAEGTEPIEQEETAGVTVSVPALEGNRLQSLLVEGEAVKGFVPERAIYTLTVPYEVSAPSVTATAASSRARVTISDTGLAVGENIIAVDVTYQGQTMRYELHVTREAETVPTMAPEADGTEEAEQGDEETPENGAHLLWASMSGGEKLLLCVLVVLLVAALALAVMALQEARRRKRRRERRKQWERKHQLGTKGMETGASETKAAERKAAGSKTTETKAAEGRPERRRKSAIKDREQASENRPVISIQDVCMNFKIAQDASDSLKEFLIRTLTGRQQFKELKALEHVSFDISQGEVVGIIGTNGSGKSTLLKIISGVLAPTKGKVLVDRNKVQLLTLGTGFDMELTARENVYLNGSLIGYTREYIDEKFDDIVAFAELEGFMDERVKNFSSGMVSRLGFAIATMRDTPEILILDEVLSVGDMFFREKSLKRVKEMMHGGSTVLIVSHSSSVIVENCTRAVWIEKGVLKADGDPKKVCELYEQAGKEAAKKAQEKKAEA